VSVVTGIGARWNALRVCCSASQTACAVTILSFTLPGTGSISFQLQVAHLVFEMLWIRAGRVAQVVKHLPSKGEALIKIRKKCFGSKL
jgi:hypothetical protein